MGPYATPCRADIALVELRGDGVVAGRTSPHDLPLFVLSAEKIGGEFKRYFPNVLSVVADGAIGGEPRHSCDVEHAPARPIECRQPQPFDSSLRCKIGIEIHCNHVVVGM